MAAAYKGLKTTWLHFLLWIERDQAQITQRIGCEPGELIQEPGLWYKELDPKAGEALVGRLCAQLLPSGLPQPATLCGGPGRREDGGLCQVSFCKPLDLRYSNVRADGLRGCFRVLIRPRQRLWPLSYTLNLGPSVPPLTS